MKRSSALLSALFLVLCASQASAGTCDISYTRTACPGKEAASFAKCDGKASCIKSTTADTIAACREKAVQACANDRLDITKSKVITATFDGKPVGNKAGGPDHCLDYAARDAEFNKCAK
jgi:hypothetical protein